MKWVLGIFFVATTAQGALPALDILTGCWKADLGKETIQERWDQFDSPMMLGTSKTINGGLVTDWEFLTITHSPKRTVMQPYLKGVKMSEFDLDLAQSTASVLWFANPKNRFPKVIKYTRTGDKLEVSLTGHTSSGYEKDFSFTLDLVACK